MKPYYCAPGVTLYLGDCIEVMRELPEASIDAVVCDPPYGLEFMGKEWDAPWRSAGEVVDDPASVGGFQDGNGGNPHSRARIRDGVGVGFQQWCEAWAREAYRVLKPGGHLAAFGGTRTHHRLVCGIEDAGFEIRDELDWMFGSGFPKSLDVSKAIDRAAGAGREVIGQGPYVARRPNPDAGMFGVAHHDPITAPATEDAQRWQGWGTALKPAHEPICLARKPLDGTVAQNVLRHGTGALNIDGTRIGTTKRVPGSLPKVPERYKGDGWGFGERDPEANGNNPNVGRWPANVLLDDEAATLLDAQAGERRSGKMMPTHTDARRNTYGQNAAGGYTTMETYGDRGGPSRFFYTAKASRSEREAGLDELPPSLRTDGRKVEHHTAHLRTNERHNDHPTVKPIALMRWLIRLVTPPGGVVLDPFLGSGTTALAALDERMDVIGIDMMARYVEIARYRVTHRHVLDEPVVREATEAVPQGRLL